MSQDKKINPSLAEKYPEVAAQWHPTKNGDLTPDMVAPACNRKVWWYLPYDDPKTGKHHDFEWKARVSNRTVRNQGCPYLTGRSAWPGFNDLQTLYPDISREWHPTKNGDLTPDRVTPASNRKVWWYLPYDDPETGRHHDFEWEAIVDNRILHKQGCPYLAGRRAWPGYNDLQTLYPAISREWHPTKNGDLTPDRVTFASNRKVWWYLPYDDPETGRHYDFEWEALVCTRTIHNEGCPYLCGKRAWPGYNDLQTLYPALSREWHPTKNGDLTPDRVRPGSNRKVWWYLPYDDSETGRHHDFEWKASVCDRVLRKIGCPYLCGNKVWQGFNDLLTKYPDIADEWHLIRNRNKTPDKVYCHASYKVWWQCRNCGHEWAASVRGRTVRGTGCPECQKRRRNNGE